MNTKFLKIFALLVFSIVFLNGCTQGQLSKSKVFKHNTPLIKGDIRQKGKKEVQKTIMSFCENYEKLCQKKYPEAPLPLEILKSVN